MSKDSEGYEVGYKKPPKANQFAPGVSGNKGRRKRPETRAEIVARVRDEIVEINGKKVTKFELMFVQALNQAIRSGKPRDIKAVMDILDKYGGLAEVDRAAEARDAGDKVLEKIFSVFERTYDIDPADVEELESCNRAEANLVMACSHCGPELRSRWAQEGYKGVAKRYGTTHVHQAVQDLHAAKQEKRS